MEKISRRQFLKLALATGAVAGSSKLGMMKIAKALAETPALPPVIWVQGQSCSGCSVSILNAQYPDIAKVITQVISMKYHATIMAGTGDVSTQAIDETLAAKKGKVVLVVEGSIPTAHEVCCTLGQREGEHIYFGDLVKEIAVESQAAIAVGTCAAFGGIPAGEGNLTGAVHLTDWLKQNDIQIPVINVSGCPPHPDWMVGTIAHYLWYGVPKLDGEGRPAIFYPDVHENCERYSYYEEGKFAKDYGEPYCLLELGCKGPVSHCDVMKRGWNGGVNNCITCGSPCIGCTASTFPDHFGVGLRGAVAKDKIKVQQIA